MLGLFPDFTPRFVRKFANLGQEVDRAVADYAHAVRTRTFPGPAECVGMPKAD
jgi:3-methyl-2-oxobutanoate hydroxymethyltransferase